MNRIIAWIKHEPVLLSFLTLAAGNLAADLEAGKVTLAVVGSALLAAFGAVVRTQVTPTLSAPVGQRPLGRKPKPADARDLHLNRYLTSTSDVPIRVDNSAAVKRWRMLLNDRLGDCTIAGYLHAVMLWTHMASGVRRFTATNGEALAGYEHVCGYSPSDPSSDQGGIERDVLKWARTNGIGGHKISAFAAVNPRHPDELRAAVFHFGCVYLGVTLDVAQQGQQTWDHVPGSAEWGGHAVILVALDENGNGKVISWGQVYNVTAAFLTAQCDEAWALLSPDWIGTGGKSPTGLNLAALYADLGKVAA